MSKKNKDMSLGDMLEKLYWVLKTKLHFDDIQAASTVVSIVLLPASFYLILINSSSVLKNVFYVTLALDVLVIIYSFVKIKYFKDIRKKENQAAKEIKIKE